MSAADAACPGPSVGPDDLGMVTNLRQDSREICERPSGKTLAPREKMGKVSISDSLSEEERKGKVSLENT